MAGKGAKRGGAGGASSPGAAKKSKTSSAKGADKLAGAAERAPEPPDCSLPDARLAEIEIKTNRSPVMVLWATVRFRLTSNSFGVASEALCKTLHTGAQPFWPTAARTGANVFACRAHTAPPSYLQTTPRVSKFLLYVVFAAFFNIKRFPKLLQRLHVLTTCVSLPIATQTPMQEVAQRLSFDWSESVTIGRAVADWLALRKGEHLGLLEADEAAEEAAREETEDLPTRTLEIMVSEGAPVGHKYLQTHCRVLARCSVS